MKKIATILMGVVAVGVGVFLIISARGLSKRCTKEAVATVVDIKMEETTEEEDGVRRTVYTYYPVFEYQAGGQTVSQKSSTGASTSPYKINDKVEILYNPDKVEEYIVKGDTSSNIAGIIFIVAGIVATVVGIFKRF